MLCGGGALDSVVLPLWLLHKVEGEASETEVSMGDVEVIEATLA
jgi:hypothetical protein